jgi:hypothetical protein
MSAIQIIITILSISVFYVAIIWFIHKASAYFHKMDQKVGNIDRKELDSSWNDSFENDISPIKTDAFVSLKKKAGVLK